MTLENLQLAISVITLLSFVFVAYRTFRDPDVSADKSISLLKDQLLYERKITDEAIKTQQNCIRSLEKEVADQKDEIKKLNETVIRLGTIIEERIPKKNI
ncbi:MAG: hypothetical protein KBG30_09885 [Bacteroidales bacterium]|nr:hypothetical protein [Bacteroidales bacterium]